MGYYHMLKNRSTRELTLSSNERIKLSKNSKNILECENNENLKTSQLKFYTFQSGFKKKDSDLLIIVFNNPVPVAAVYSKTSTPSAPIIWDKKNNNGLCKVLIVNSGNANAHTGVKGINNINKYVKVAAKHFMCSLNQIMVSSTGVIGEQIDPNKIIKKINLIDNYKPTNLQSASKTIMTTDTFAKTFHKKIKINKKDVNIYGMSKGSGMIAPNMGTMLAYIFIDADISKKFLKKLLINNLENSFNAISVDGDTSTSDTVMLFYLKKEREGKITKTQDLKKISNALFKVMFQLALQVVSDGEGISKLIDVNVSGAKDYIQAKNVAFSIANSSLVKTAIAGEDANWGRVIMAIGKADTKINQNKIKLKFGNITLASNGEKSKKISIQKLDSYMKNKIIQILIYLGIGKSSKSVFSSDLTHDYITINADYRS